jgi:tyrosine phenol-lyase
VNPPPWKIKVVEPITLAAPARRRTALEEAGYNTFLLRSEDVFIDLLTDSGTSALSQEQRAAMELGDEAYAGSRSFFRLEAAVREAYGFRHVIPTHQGRGAEHLLSRLLIRPGQLVPSALYFTTSRVHAELAGGLWVDVSIPEATDPTSAHPFKGNVDLAALERVLAEAGTDGVAFVRVEACLNMAGGQPFSLENLAGVRELTRAHGVPLILDATRISENALFVKRREPGYADWPLAALIREIARHADGAVFSSKKDHFVPIGGVLALADDAVAQRARELVVIYEGFPHYGGLAGHDMEALAQGIRESTDEATVAHYVGQSALLGGLLEAEGVPLVAPVGAHGVFLDAKRFLPHLSREDFPAQSLAAAIYLAGGVRTMERGIVSGQHGDEPYDGLELVRLTLPRRVYTQEHLAYVAEVVADVHAWRAEVPGLRMTYEPASLRFFQARFEPRAAFPPFGAPPVVEPAEVMRTHHDRAGRAWDAVRMLSLRRRRQPAAPGPWSERTGRTRVLVENPDRADLNAHAAVLRNSGYDVATCIGPEEAGEEAVQCPLLAGQRCPLVDDADVVVSTSSLPDCREILAAIHTSSRTPVVFEAPAPTLERFGDVVGDAVVLPLPVTAGRLRGAVAAAAALAAER